MIEKIPENSTLLVIGPPGVGKIGWLLDVGTRVLNRNEKLVFVTLDMHPNEVSNHLLDFGAHSGKVNGGDLRIVDGYTAILDLDVAPSPGKNIHRVTSLSSLGEIAESVSNAVDEIGRPARVIFYTLSSLFLYNSVQSIAKFFQTLSSRIRTEYGFGAFALQQGIHEEKTVTLLSSMADGVVEMRFNEGLEREWRMHHLTGISTSPRWQDFEVGRHGIMADPSKKRMVSHLLDYEYESGRKEVLSE